MRRKTRFIVIGEDNPAPFTRLATMLGLRKQVTILSGRDDVPRFLLAGDLLLHPALDENAGIILLEAIVSGLPVLATDPPAGETHAFGTEIVIATSLTAN